MKTLQQIIQAKRVMSDLAAPADPDLFIEMIGVFKASVASDERAGVGSLEQDAVKRALSAVREALEARGVKTPMPYYVRISTLPQLFAHPRIVERFVHERPSDDGAPEVKNTLLKAAAICRFSLLPKRFGFDIEDVIEKAKALEAIEASA